MCKNFLCMSIIGRTLNVILGCRSSVIFNHLSNVILGFIPRIHAKHTSLDTRVKPEYDGKGVNISTPEYDHKVMQCGRSMIEMLGVLAIIGVLSVGGIAGYSKAMEKFKINKTIQQITEIAANVQTLYMQQKDFNGLTTETAVQMGVVPDELGTSFYYGTVITHAFGNNVEIGLPWSEDNPNYFQITFWRMTKEACMALATADWNSISSSGVVGIGINDMTSVMYSVTPDNCATIKANYYSGYFTCSKSLPISPAIAAQYCGKQVDSSDFNSFAIIFKK